MNIVHNDRFIPGNSRTADSLAHWNAHMLGWRSAKRAERKGLRIVRVEHVETGPVVVGQAIWNDLNDEVLQRRKIARSLCKCAHFGKNLGKGVLAHASILRLSCFYAAPLLTLDKFYEVHRCRVHAVAQAGWLWSVIEHMPQM